MANCTLECDRRSAVPRGGLSAAEVGDGDFGRSAGSDSVEPCSSCEKSSCCCFSTYCCKSSNLERLFPSRGQLVETLIAGVCSSDAVMDVVAACCIGGEEEDMGARQDQARSDVLGNLITNN